MPARAPRHMPGTWRRRYRAVPWCGSLGFVIFTVVSKGWAGCCPFKSATLFQHVFITK